MKFFRMALLTLLSDFFLLLHLQLHGPKSHSSVSTRTPVQSAPLFSGFGFVQVRIRTLVPKPQVTLHGEYSDHTLQAPFTKCQSQSFTHYIVLILGQQIMQLLLLLKSASRIRKMKGTGLREVIFLNRTLPLYLLQNRLAGLREGKQRLLQNADMHLLWSFL